MNYSKAPWRAQGNIIFSAEIGKPVAKLYSQAIPGQKSGFLEDASNAKLIASAPKLLATLQTIASDLCASRIEDLRTLALEVIAETRRE